MRMSYLSKGTMDIEKRLRINYKGKTYTLEELSKETGVPVEKIKEIYGITDEFEKWLEKTVEKFEKILLWEYGEELVELHVEPPKTIKDFKTRKIPFFEKLERGDKETLAYVREIFKKYPIDIDKLLGRKKRKKKK